MTSSFHSFLSQSQPPGHGRRLGQSASESPGPPSLQVRLRADWSAEPRVSAHAEVEQPAARVPPSVPCRILNPVLVPASHRLSLAGLNRTRDSEAPSSLAPPSIQPSRCTHLRGSTCCTCLVGFAMSMRDNHLYTGAVDQSGGSRSKRRLV